MKLDHTASTSDGINRVISESVPVQFLPAQVTEVPKEVLKGFPHTKRVGNYLLGRTLGEGSFAKVKEGLHTLTGEKVRGRQLECAEVHYLWVKNGPQGFKIA